MYFNETNKFFHGIMFHHFHDDSIHSKSQGSISRDDLYKIIKFIGKNNILDAGDFFHKFKNKKLKSNEICLTFDDGIKSQFDIALPVLEDLKIKSFFFVYSSMFDNKPDFLEVFRYFRLNYYKNVNEFYEDFFNSLNRKKIDEFFILHKLKIKNLKIKFPYYSIEDIEFRLIRDEYLKKKEYESAMFSLMNKKKFVPENFFSKLFFSKEDLKSLHKLGHLIGLHSHSHPTLIEKLDFEKQLNEYKTCISKLSDLLQISKHEIKWMSHPCGSYNQDTLKILSDLGIEIGFKQIMTIEKEKGMKKINNSYLELAREDHSKIMKRANL